MNVLKAKILADKLIKKHKANVKFYYTMDAERPAHCTYAKNGKEYVANAIEMSAYLIYLNSEKIIKEIIKHEIAHALGKWSYNHGPKFEEISDSIGHKKEKTVGWIMPCNYVCICSGCGAKWARQKISNKTYICPYCGEEMWYKKAPKRYNVNYIKSRLPKLNRKHVKQSWYERFGIR